MRSTLIILAISAFLNGCYQGTSGRIDNEDSETDLSSDYDSIGEYQQDINDIQDVIDGHDADDAIDDEPSEEYEACDPPSLVLQPVTIMDWIGPDWPRDCEYVGITEVRVLLFQGNDLVADSTIPCFGDTIVVGPVPPGSYDLAAVAGQLFVTGVNLLRIVYPEVPSCHPEDIACNPIAITVETCGSTIIPLLLYCDESFAPCYGCCGDG